jgi:hypothetical protein
LVIPATPIPTLGSLQAFYRGGRGRASIQRRLDSSAACADVCFQGGDA